ncbi:MAG: transcription antitermination factor NusB [Erysipelotrichaceae bacterium]|nr:transcription antitermination factor NusB [Erysipelotrichaceae bacterium]
MSYSRNKLQELAMVCTYQYLFYLKDADRPSPSEILENVTKENIDDNDKFIKQLFLQVIKNTNELVNLINSSLDNWDFERLGLMEKSILLTSLAQGKYLNQPKQVVIDVAVELSKKYCEEKAYKLINGVLDKVL